MPTAKISDDNTYFILSDYFESPAQAYDEKGKLVWQVEFDIYGRIREDSFNNKHFLPFRQLGQYEDEELGGRYYNRFRYYSPETGAYISKDPIGIDGGLNVYGYVKDSNFYIDPFGLARKPMSSRLPEGSRTGVYGPSNGTLVKTNPETGDIIQIRTYDSNGNPVKDIDFGHDHGFGDPDAHDWDYPSDKAPNKVRSDGRVIDSDDLSLIDDAKNGKFTCV